MDSDTLPLEANLYSGINKSFCGSSGILEGVDEGFNGGKFQDFIAPLF